MRAPRGLWAGTANRDDNEEETGGEDEPGGRHLPSAWGRPLPGAIPFLPWPLCCGGWWCGYLPTGVCARSRGYRPPSVAGTKCPVASPPLHNSPPGAGWPLAPAVEGGALGAVRGPSALLAARTARIMQQGAARARTARTGHAAPAGVGDRGGTGGGSGGRGRWMEGGGGSYRAPAGPTTLQSGGAAAGVLGAPPRGLRPPPVRFRCGGGEAKATRGHDTWCIGREV